MFLNNICNKIPRYQYTKLRFMSRTAARTKIVSYYKSVFSEVILCFVTFLAVIMSLERDGVGVSPSLGGVGPNVGPALVPTSAADPRSLLLQEMREQNFDVIRFATYRTACKLRYVQKKCNCE